MPTKGSIIERVFYNFILRPREEQQEGCEGATSAWEGAMRERELIG